MDVNIGRYTNKGGQNISVKVEAYDCWSMDRTMAWVLLPLFIKFREGLHSFPNEFSDPIANEWDGQKVFDFIKNDQARVEDEGFEKWVGIISHIIWSLEQLTVSDDYEDKYFHGKFQHDFVETEPMINPITGKSEKMYEMKDLDPSGHWHDRVGHELHDLQIQIGIDYISKYWRNFWD